MIKAKNIDSSYFYTDSNFDQNIMKMILHGKRLDKTSESYKMLYSDIKRFCKSSAVTSMLMSDNVVLVYNNQPMPRALKVMTVKDIKSNNKAYKIFIDVTEICSFTNENEFVIRELNFMETFLTVATVHMMYYTDPKIIMSPLVGTATEIYVSLFRYILDYKYKISNSENKNNIAKYMISKFFLQNVLEKKDDDYSENICKRISGITNREIEILNIRLSKIENPFEDISTIIDCLSKVLEIRDLKLDVFVQGWLFLYGSGTHFAMELFTSLCELIIHTYNGTFFNNQKTIEKIVGTNEITKMYSTIISRGGEYIART